LPKLCTEIGRQLISLTAYAHFGARLGEPDFLKTMYRSTIYRSIYLINLLWKLGLGLGLVSELLQKQVTTFKFVE